MKFSAVSSLLATLAFVCSSVVNAELNPEFTMATSVAFDSLVLKAGKPVVVLFCIE
jgi:hypothetical protein